MSRGITHLYSNTILLKDLSRNYSSLTTLLLKDLSRNYSSLSTVLLKDLTRNYSSRTTLLLKDLSRGIACLQQHYFSKISLEELLISNKTVLLKDFSRNYTHLQQNNYFSKMSRGITQLLISNSTSNEGFQVVLLAVVHWWSLDICEYRFSQWSHARMCP